ncbi:uncharacterized protein LOC131161647 [Malania oleifera]|uniref:uncharacterized protein LOC131161647 n=1 Tax=Malania oleifera TaxID=397392 RepID=UPI0025AE79E4|nr:uncharacterized protein LOC131161647 [Malania oleifera]
MEFSICIFDCFSLNESDPEKQRPFTGSVTTMASQPLLFSPSSSFSSTTPCSPSSSSLTFPSQGPMPRRNALGHELWGNFNGGGIRFGTETKSEDDSGVCSPPLWKTSRSPSPKSGNSPPHPHQHRKRSLSPASRTQAIARGRRELMDLVRNMPESSYELSLKDLVEQAPVEVRRQSPGEETKLRNEGLGSGKKKKSEKAPQMKRSGSIDNGGFLLKMVFPIKLGSKKRRKKKNSATNTCAKVSPKPQASDGSGKGGDKEWWKNRSGESSGGRSGSANSGSTRSSGSSSRSSSSSSVNRHVSGFLPSCWSFLRTRKTKKAGENSHGSLKTPSELPSL